MKSIIERADDIYLKDNGLDYKNDIMRIGYIRGAKEQRDIDIEKATEWFNANWRKYIDTDADGMIRFAGWKNDFVKTMKE